LTALLERLGSLERREDDELIVAVNRRGLPQGSRPGIEVIDAAEIATPAFARNRGARAATGEWLVFIDADTDPDPSLVDAYFDPPPGEQTAVLAGGIEDAPIGNGPAARHSARRAHMHELTTLDRPGRSYAQTANCAIRRAAFVAVGGFAEHARAGEDADLCFRLADAGWRVEHRPRARVRHHTRATVAGLLAQLARHGSGAAWLNRRYPGEFPPPRPLGFGARLARSARTAVTAFGRGDRDAAALAAVELAAACAFEAGRLLPNRASRR
jgi:GT2 family glycosyltransferase